MSIRNKMAIVDENCVNVAGVTNESYSRTRS
jgi:hypothetical protein